MRKTAKEIISLCHNDRSISFLNSDLIEIWNKFKIIIKKYDTKFKNMLGHNQFGKAVMNDDFMDDADYDDEYGTS